MCFTSAVLVLKYLLALLAWMQALLRIAEAEEELSASALPRGGGGGGGGGGRGSAVCKLNEALMLVHVVVAMPREMRFQSRFLQARMLTYADVC